MAEVTRHILLMACLALAISGCSNEPVEAAAPASTPQPPVAAAPPELMIPVNGFTQPSTRSDFDMVMQVRGLIPTDVDVVQSALNTCSAFDSGRNAQYVLDQFVDFGLTKIAALQFVGSATVIYCNYYESFLPDSPLEYTPS